MTGVGQVFDISMQNLILLSRAPNFGMTVSICEKNEMSFFVVNFTLNNKMIFVLHNVTNFTQPLIDVNGRFVVSTLLYSKFM